MRTIQIAVLISILFSGIVHAQQNWTCTYPGYSSTTPAPPVLVQFRIEGGNLIETSRGSSDLRYRILENNELALVAVWAFASERNNRPEIGTFVIMINKKTEQFRRGAISFGEDVQPRWGSCIAK